MKTFAIAMLLTQPALALQSETFVIDGSHCETRAGRITGLVSWRQYESTGEMTFELPHATGFAAQATHQLCQTLEAATGDLATLTYEGDRAILKSVSYTSQGATISVRLP